MTVCLTMDTDWAPEEVVADSLQLLKRYGTKATIFTTGPYQCLLNADPNLIRIGLHPACRDFDEMEKNIRQLQEVYPWATALRVHGLVHTSRFWPLFHRLGIRATSNIMLPGHPDLIPTHFLPGVREYPIHFMDDYHLLEGGTMDQEMARKLASGDNFAKGVKVLAFHPIHVFLNCESMDRYEACRGRRQDIIFLKGRIHNDMGCRKLFLSVLEALGERGLFLEEC